MFCCVLFVAALMLAGAAATNQAFTSSGEMNISSCPITYYGQRYDKVYVAFSANRFAVCFKGLYKPGIKNDCILMSGGTADRGDLSVFTREIPTGSGVHKLLPNLKNVGKCVNIIPLKDSQQSQIEQVELGNFGTQAILAIKTYSGYTNVDVEADSQVNGITVSKQKFQTNETNKGVITDVSGCRLAGVAYKTNTTIRDPNTCSTVTCDVNGVARAISHCGPMERCQGDGSCILNAMCTVTGPTIINFIGTVHTVLDRCGYTLLKPLSIPGFQVLAVFQERRRKDVSFLDRVILQLDQAGAKISLEQGGRVQLNDKVLTLNTTAQVVHGVELSRDQTGVTAKISGSNHTISILFDGYTALIHMRGPSGVTVHGLCGISGRSFSQEKVSEHSATGCEIKHEDAADSTINVNTTTKWCYIMEQAPFAACNKHFTSEPFISACIHTLHKYPAVDGLKCQFLEAYTRACSRHSNVTLENWRSKTGCSAVPQAFCQDKFCSAHEFCGENSNGGELRCHCRAIFASKYRPTSAFGEPTVCVHTSTSVTLANCLLEDRGIDYSVLHLNDQACKGEMDNLTHMVTFNFKSNTCGAVVLANKSQIIYKNTIVTQNSSMFGVINRHDPVHIDFSCYYTQPDMESLAIKLKDSSVIQQITSGQWNYTLTMKAYTNSDRTEAIQSGTDIRLDEKIWVELKTDGLDENMILLVTDSCWATDQSLPSGSLRYDLIINGCPNPADQTVKVVGNGLGTSNYFSYNTFQFSGKTGDVYLHCRVQLCVRQGNNCAPRCSQAERRRRSVMSRYEDENPGFITMAWTY